MEKENVENMARALAKLHGINYNRLPENGTVWSWFLCAGLGNSKNYYRDKAQQILEIIEKKG